MPTELTVAMAKQTIAQLELKNLELQMDNIKHQLAGMGTMMELIRMRGPQLEAQLEELERALAERRSAAKGEVKA